MTVHLRIEGPGGAASPRDRTLNEELITIGRDAVNVLCLDDDAHTISRRHAAIRSGPPAALVDLGSRNGTYLNGRRLEPRRSYPLRPGDVIRLGPFRLVLHREGTSSGAVTPEAYEPDEPETYRPPPDDATREELARAVQELRLLNELAVEIGASLDANVVMDRVVRRSLEALEAEQGLITLLVDPVERDEAGGEVSHWTMVRTGAEFGLNAQLEAWMVQQRRPLLLNDPRGHPGFRHVRWERALRNLLSVPLFVRGAMTGLLTVYNKRDGGGFTESDLQLASIIAAQSAHIIENARLYEEGKELLRMQQELQVALDIQTNLLPAQPPVIEGYDVAGCSLPAEVVGGDHFDYIPRADGQWALCVGDVSGKGLPAALLMANLQATLRAQTFWTDSVTSCLHGTNELLYRSTNRRTFVTLFYCVLDPATHTLRYANAGHNRPLLLGPDGVRPLTEAGFVLGALRSTRYPASTLTLAPDDTLLIFSDGVVEARRADGDLYGDDRLEALVARHRGASAQALIDAILDDVFAHVGAAPQADDVTLLALHRRP